MIKRLGLERCDPIRVDFLDSSRLPSWMPEPEIALHVATVGINCVAVGHFWLLTADRLVVALLYEEDTGNAGMLIQIPLPAVQSVTLLTGTAR